MENIKQVVKNKEWQALRRSMQHSWTNQTNTNKNLLKLKKYLNNTNNEHKLRRVHNYLGALRGVHYSGIAEMRSQVRRKRQILKTTHKN
jgi:hypothetical protein